MTVFSTPMMIGLGEKAAFDCELSTIQGPFPPVSSQFLPNQSRRTADS